MERIETDFSNYKNLIKSLIGDDNIAKILRDPLSRLFSKEVQTMIRNNCNSFFEEFERSSNNKKYEYLISVTKDISEWIPRFLEDTRNAKMYRRKFDVIFELLHLQSEEAVKSFPMSENFLHQCGHMDILDKGKMEQLIAVLELKGPTIAKYQLLWEIPTRSENCYGKLLYLLHRNKTNYIEKFCDDLHKSIDGCHDRDAENYIMAYADSIVTKNMNVSEISDDDDDGGVMECDHGQALEAEVRSDREGVLEADGLQSSNLNDLSLAMDFLNLDSPPKDSFQGQASNSEAVSGKFASTSNNNDCKIGGKEPISLPVVPQSLGSIVKDSGQDDSEHSDNNDDDDTDNEDSKICNTTDMDMDDLFGSLKDKTADNLLIFSTDCKPSTEGLTKLDIRKYQEELAREGIQGNNVLICAPTGSGKTIVAVKIVEEHLQKNPQGKVAFVVHRIALVEQQYAQFSKYLKNKITRLSGSAKSSSTPLVGQVASFDVFVMTSDILKNALEQDNETKLKSVGEFSMILFDECHNCDKKHAYNRIMNHYFETKERGDKVPQIIGLTASTGTNKANTMSKAMKRLYTLCANLDCYLVSTVKEFLDELKINQSVPIEEIILAPPRDQDKFEIELQFQMKECETLLREMNKRDFFPTDSETQLIFSIPEDRMHQKYANFISKLELLLNNTKAEMNGREAIYAITQYLNAFTRALMVNHLFRAEDAIKVIQEYLHLDTHSKSTCKVAEMLRKKLTKLEKGNAMQTPNPCLKTLQDRILEQLKYDTSSRIIVFVREREYTQILKDIFTALNDSNIKCDTIVGNTISAEKRGLTQNKMEEVLGRFRNGQCNVLFSTTVAEEGLDVQKCNLVIRYGHVTNETAMVQSRGRARAIDSKYLVIVPNRLQWQINKENVNKYRESMMYRAIEKFQAMPKAERDHQIDECTYERKLSSNIKTNKIILRSTSEDKVRLFCCKKCNTQICKSSDIRVAESAHHLVLNTGVFDQMKVNPKNKQISCKKCSNHLGNRQKYKGRDFPNLTIAQFTVIIEGESLSKSYKKWGEIDFVVVNVEFKELLSFPAVHSLSE